MKRAAAAAAAFFLMGTPVASARGETSAQLLRRGITHALGRALVEAERCRALPPRREPCAVGRTAPSASARAHHRVAARAADAVVGLVHVAAGARAVHAARAEPRVLRDAPHPGHARRRERRRRRRVPLVPVQGPRVPSARELLRARERGGRARRGQDGDARGRAARARDPSRPAAHLGVLVLVRRGQAAMGVRHGRGPGGAVACARRGPARRP